MRPAKPPPRSRTQAKNRVSPFIELLLRLRSLMRRRIANSLCEPRRDVLRKGTQTQSLQAILKLLFGNTLASSPATDPRLRDVSVNQLTKSSCGQRGAANWPRAVILSRHARNESRRSVRMAAAVELALAFPNAGCHQQERLGAMVADQGECEVRLSARAHQVSCRRLRGTRGWGRSSGGVG